MSGPKLSEYELEQMRKAEMERIQRAIAEKKASLLRIERDKMREIELCRQELEKLSRQKRMLATSALNQEDCKLIEKCITERMAEFENLSLSWNDLRVQEINDSNDLGEISAVEEAMQSDFSSLLRKKEMLLGSNTEYQELMSKLATNLTEQIKGTSFSLEEAMKGLSPPKNNGKSIVDAATRDLRDELLNKIAVVQESSLITEEMQERLENAKELVRVSESADIITVAHNDVNVLFPRKLTHPVKKGTQSFFGDVGRYLVITVQQKKNGRLRRIEQS